MTGPNYKREEAWEELYDKFGEEKTGETDHRDFAQLFEERGLKGYDKGEKDFGSPDQGKKDGTDRFTYPSRPQFSLDLHGKTTEQARNEVNRFIKQCREAKLRLVKIITGIGRDNDNMKSKLRPVVVERLNFYVDDGLLKKYETAPPADGGYGAIYVYFK
ncbi:Smr/MutS family protein [Candidatus Peregrinibacteria bacterium]|nr:Smr/MutS family protein [Candidatus Peregrinibacteria bacterium]